MLNLITTYLQEVVSLRLFYRGEIDLYDISLSSYLENNKDL